MSADLEARLREIVLRHTVVGGYPDTMAIARECYALDRIEPMTLERTVWRGETSRDETRNLDEWIRTAPDDMLGRLLNDDMSVTQEKDQALLARVWSDASDDMDGLLDGHILGSREDRPTYHWGEGERIRLRRLVTALRPEHLRPDPGQGTLL